ncbi:MAG TPA: endolytic transglycosylase MltG, partial [Acidimicrobiaceae bacterium]|nr:endolytic transglycosylase MltG [Acidimicrobiaceae bacterium]
PAAAPSAKPSLWSRVVETVVRGGPSRSADSTPGLGRPAGPHRAQRRSTSRTRRAAADTAPHRIGGHEGIDYEVVYTGRGPGTVGGVVMLLLFLGGALFAGVQAVGWVREKLDPPGEPAGEVVVALPPGSSTSGISELLAANGVIPDATAYEWYVRLRGGPTFQAGDYVFRRNSSVWNALEVLEEGPHQVDQALQLTITVPEGLTVVQIAGALDRVPGLPFTGAEFLEVLRRAPAVSTVARPPDPLPDEARNPSEGMLFGDTYFLDLTATAEQLATTMSERLDAVLTELDFDEPPAEFGLTPYETLVVASIVEAEASRAEDRPRLARVIYNRLASGTMLGMDATVSYLVDGAELDAAALAVDSPYNTRLNPGLPPTPIGSPSRESLQAALAPAAGDWEYVVRTDDDGTLSFSATYEEFLADKEVCVELGYCR